MTPMHMSEPLKPALQKGFSQQAVSKPSNLPEHKIRSGAISATIWKNEADGPQGKVVYNTVSFERTYKDKNGQWRSTNKLRATDIPRAVLVLNKAYEYLALGEQEE